MVKTGFNQFGDCEGATLSPGNVHSVDGWQELLEPVVKRYQKKGLRLLFRGDAAFGKPEAYEYLEQETIGRAIRLSANAVLQREIAHLLVRPAGWFSRRPIVSYHDFTCQAQNWSVSRRVVAKSLPRPVAALVTREMLTGILERISQLPLAPG